MYFTYSFLFLFLKKIYYDWFTLFCQFLLYRKVTQSCIYVYICICIYTYIYTHSFSHIILHHVLLQVIRYIVPCAIQQDLIAHPLQMHEFSSANPRFPIHPTPPTSSLTNISLSYMSMIFSVLVTDHLCYVLDSTYKGYHMVSVFIFLIYSTQYESV